jgi:hypothetical protein
VGPGVVDIFGWPAAVGVIVTRMARAAACVSARAGAASIVCAASVGPVNTGIDWLALGRVASVAAVHGPSRRLATVGTLDPAADSGIIMRHLTGRQAACDVRQPSYDPPSITCGPHAHHDSP